MTRRQRLSFATVATLARAVLPLATLATAVLAPTRPLAAQIVRGTVVAQGSNEPVASTIVRLVDASGKRRAGAISDQDGRFAIKAPAPGRYSLHADRIGFKSVNSAPFELAVGETIEQKLVAPAVPTMLAGITITGSDRCVVRPQEGMEAARVWEEARKALDATVLTQEQRLLRLTFVEFERDLSPSHSVLRETSRRRSGVSENPFVSAPAESLSAHGYVRVSRDSSEYLAPDAAVLLSESFAGDHCLRAVRDDEHKGLVGLAFEPAKHRKKKPDIKGVLWLSDSTSELRFMQYQYTKLPVPTRGDAMQSRVEFKHLPTGAWIVERWVIRMPLVQKHQKKEADGTFAIGQPSTRVGVREVGGEVVETLTMDGRKLSELESLALSGSVFDSTRSMPLAGATVSLAQTSHSATTDSTGHFRLEGLREGNYTVTVSHPLFPLLGVSAPRRDVQLRSGHSATVEFATPSAATLVTALCRDSTRKVTAALVMGRVRDVVSGTPLANTRVMLSWEGWSAEEKEVRRAQQNDSTHTESTGVYRICVVPADVAVTVHAGEAGNPTGTAALRSRDGELVIRDLRVAPGATGEAVGGAASLVVSVKMADGRPVPQAQVRVVGSRSSGVTDSAGVVRLANLPAGTQVVDVRVVGYAPARSTVDLEAALQGQTVVTLEQKAQLLTTVRVKARRGVAAEFEKHRAHGTGYYLTLEQIQRMHAARVTDLLRSVPGVRVVYNAGGGVSLRLRGGSHREVRRIGLDSVGSRVLQSGQSTGGNGNGSPDPAEAAVDPRTSFMSRLAKEAAQCEVVYYIDGLRARPVDGEIDLEIRPEDVYGIEVYPNSTGVPAQYDSPEAQCGVVLLWTRLAAGKRDAPPEE